jgi:hypothetical protein
MTTRTINKYQDILDSRDIIARIEELESELEVHHEEATEANETNLDFEEWLQAVRKDQSPAHAHEYWEEVVELQTLRTLADEAEGYCEDWKYGAALIRDSYFTDYAQELLQDCDELPKDIPHYIVIDWEATARNIQQDYTSVEFDGVTYWVR